MKALINDSLVKKLQPPTERRYEITWDSKLPSFGVCITSGGTVSFLLDYRVQQKHRRVKLGRYPALSVAAAREKAKNWQGQVTEKKDPGVKQQANGQPTMMQLADEYLQEHAKENKRAGSIRNDKGILDNIIRPKLGSYTVASITRRDIDKLHKSRSSTPYHANRMLSLLSTMFTCAIAWGYRKDNPARHVKRFDEHTKERWLSEEELKRFSVALNAYRDQSAADALRLLLFTGCREMEALSADWSQFDLARGTWTKPSHRTKERKTEHVPLNDLAIRLLEKMRAESNGAGPLFPGENGKHRVVIRKPFLAVCRAAGLTEAHIVQGKRRQLTKHRPTLRIRDLSHSFASHLVSDGASLELVGRLMGHCRPETTARYAHFSDASLRATSNRLGAVFSVV